MEREQKFDDRKRTGDSTPLQDVFTRILKAYQWDKKYDELEVLAKWEEMMGKYLSFE